MNKFLKCWVFILCILFILLILFTDRVNAETCERQIIDIANRDNSVNAIVGKNTISLNLNTNSYLGNYNMFKGQIYYIVKDTNNTISSNINITNWNLSLTCQSTEVISTGGNTWGYITYADGTSATILSSLKGAVCDYYQGQLITQNNTATLTTNWKYEPNITQYTISYRDANNTGLLCQTTSNGNFVCPYSNDRGVKSINIDYWLEKQNATIQIGLATYNQLTKCNSDTQEIIINNNQNTQSIIQQQQNINSSITSDNITGNNSTTTINNLGGTFQTQQDFLLNLIKLPYTFFSALSNTIQNQCSPLTIGTIFDYNLVMPCVNLNNLLGDVWTLIIDVIFAGVIASAFVRRVTKYIREVCTLDTNALNTGGVKIW